MEFFEDDLMVPNKYPHDCAVGQRPIIMIKHDENIFPANDSREKVWTLNSQSIL